MRGHSDRVEPEDLERRRTELHHLIRLLPIPRRRPLDSVSHVERSDEAGLRASRTTWTYYARADGGFGVGSIPERAFIEEARLPSIDAVMDWVWLRIIEQFLRAHVLPRSGARHGVDALVVATLGPSDERDAVLDVSRAPSGGWPSWPTGTQGAYRPWSPAVRTLRWPRWRRLLEVVLPAVLAT